MTVVLGVLGVVLPLLIVMISSRRSRSSRDSWRTAVPATPPVSVQHALQTPLPPQTRDRTLELIRLGQKIQAIKELRAATGYGLRDAKDVVDALEAGSGPASSANPAQHPSVTAAAPDRSLADRARHLVDQNRETQAIRLVCDETGMGISEAQAFIRSLRS